MSKPKDTPASGTKVLDEGATSIKTEDAPESKPETNEAASDKDASELPPKTEDAPESKPESNEAASDKDASELPPKTEDAAEPGPDTSEAEETLELSPLEQKLKETFAGTPLGKRFFNYVDKRSKAAESGNDQQASEPPSLEQKLTEAFASHPVADRFFSTPDQVLHFSNYDAVTHQQRRGKDANDIQCHERPDQPQTATL